MEVKEIKVVDWQGTWKLIVLVDHKEGTGTILSKTKIQKTWEQ